MWYHGGMERFWSKVRITPGCWEWTAAVNHGGYGLFQYTSRSCRRAHRVSYELAYGPIPKGMVVMHKCDNPPCVNPDHLELGTMADNNRDKGQKGRARNGRRNRTHCPSGHEYTEENTGWYKTWRYCKTCNRDRARAWYKQQVR